MSLLNITAYKFVSFSSSELLDLKQELKENAVHLGIKGTILLSEEGINLSLAGEKDAINNYIRYLTFKKKFEDMEFKESYSHDYPFSRMLVKIKKEIIRMNCPEITPEFKTAPHLPAQEFKKWYEEGKDMIVLDTRNDYEIASGTFKNAVNLHIQNFYEFPKAIQQLPADTKKKTIVTFCTGGVRCEKAAQFMLNQGYEDVYQLDGGILKYFSECGADFYEGECFVFDKRITVDPKLQEANTTQCMNCRMTVKENQLSCEYCGGTQLHPKANNAHHSNAEQCG